MSNHFNVAEFEKIWTKLGREICQAIYTNPEVQEIKTSLLKNGFLSLEQKSKFIDICDRTKYEVIYSQYGKEGSDGYKQFSQNWESWFQEKGVGSKMDRGQRNSVEHILFGSTPDPEQFLKHFEQEMLGSMREDR